MSNETSGMTLAGESDDEAECDSRRESKEANFSFFQLRKLRTSFAPCNTTSTTPGLVCAWLPR